MTIKITSVMDIDGDVHWYKGQVRHRDDGPAVEYASGAKIWFQNGRIHRTDGPAIIWEDGSKFWYLRGIKYECMDWILKVYEMSQKKKS